MASLISQHAAVRHGIAYTQPNPNTQAERRLDWAVGELLQGTEWECAGAVWTVENHFGEMLRMRSGTEYHLTTVARLLTDPHMTRRPCVN
jgi:hypothetical protein